ncbi:SAM-dependent methyltransferase [Streptosporangium becharense]|nr:SAM-dependent methyltransferase [Streptosporangium becharense]
MASPPPERPRFDPAVPSVSRITDYLLGGKNNFAADREAARASLAIAPELPVLAREGRRFLRRAVGFLAGAGVRQFVDIGCGLPTRDSVHQVLHTVAPDARVVYVDNDPMVVTHARALLKDESVVTVVEADARDPERLLTHPRLTATIDLGRPVAFLLFSVLTDVTDDVQAMQITTGLQKAMAPGGYLALSHAVRDLCPDRTARLAALYQRQGSVTGPYRANLRSRAEVEVFFDGLELVEPGVVHLPRWRPDGPGPHHPDAVWVVGGIGRKG